MSPKDQLIEKAKTFGIDTEGLNDTQLKAAIKKATAEKVAELTVAVTEAKHEFEGLTEINTVKEFNVAQEKIDLAELALSEFTGKPLVSKSEPTDGTIEINGSMYTFKKTTPERFNFLGTNKTQDEWLQDKDAMELLVLCNSSFVKLVTQ
jgi:hypothetical protein